MLARLVDYPGATSVNSRWSNAPQSTQTSKSTAVMQTLIESHLAQAAVGSPVSGGGSGGSTPDSVPPTAVVTGSKVVLQSAHTWLKQQSGVQL